MGDDITIGVTEIVNNIEVTAQPNDQIVDISVIDNADDVTLNITPTVIEINVNRGSSFAKWGTILGTLSDQTDLQDALDLKANLVGGKVPASELPSYVDDVVEVANYAALPATGETGKMYVTLDNNKIYRWSGSVYIEIAANNAIWGAITGTLSSQTDLQAALNAKQNTITLTTTGTSGSATLVGSTLNIPNYTTDISGLVPYTGATANVDLGTHKLTASDLVVNHASGSGVAASITKGGSGEALTVLKTSGSGNAASILGGVTLLDELHLNTDLADAYIASAATWNAKQAALNGTGFVKISGTTISYDNSTYALDNAVVHLTGTETIGGVKTFSSSLILNSSLNITSGAYSIIYNPSNSTYWQTYVDSSSVFNFGLNGTNVKASLTNLGDFTANSFIKSGGTSTQYLMADGSVSTLSSPITGSGTTNYLPKFTGSTSIGDSAIYDNSGNVGIGIVPETWSSTIKALQIGTRTSLYDTNGSAILGYNIYSNTTNKYIESLPAMRYIINDLGHTWQTAPSGTADANITFTDSMTINTSGSVKVFNLGTGLVYSNGGALTSTNPSDERLKDDITNIEYGLTEILQLRPVSYILKNDTINQGKQFGFIAQEVQEIMPELVKEFETKDGEEDVIRLGLDKEGIYAALINAIKEQNEVLEKLKAEIDLLKQNV